MDKIFIKEEFVDEDVQENIHDQLLTYEHPVKSEEIEFKTDFDENLVKSEETNDSIDLATSSFKHEDSDVGDSLSFNDEQLFGISDIQEESQEGPTKTNVEFAEMLDLNEENEEEFGFCGVSRKRPIDETEAFSCDSDRKRTNTINLDETQSKIEETKKIKCDYCKYSSDDVSEFQRHVIIAHPGHKIRVKKKFFCKKCDYSTYLVSNMRQHFDKVHVKRIVIKNFKCTLCSHKEKSKEKMRQHFELYHKTEIVKESEKKKFQCSFCKYSANDKSLIEIHVKIDHQKCDYCDFTSSKTLLKKHVQSTHPKVKLFRCPFCEYSTKDSSNARKHIENVHRKCDQCDFRAFQGTTLESHMKLLHPKSKYDSCELTCTDKADIDEEVPAMFKCTFCKYSASTALQVKEHMKTEHSKCVYCGDLNPDEKLLEIHIRAAHPDLIKCFLCEYSSLNAAEVHDHIESEHSQCVYCGNVSLNETLLDIHIQSTHPKIVCEFCEYSSLYAGEVKEHIKNSHIKCNQCAFRSDKTNLEIHVQSSHPITKLYKCGFCKYYSAYEVALVQKHIGNVHRKCDFCDYRTSKVLLVNHIRDAHPDVTLFKCEFCDFDAIELSMLQTHIANVHSKKKIEKGEAKKTFHCQSTNCEYETFDKTELEQHVRTVHLDWKIYRCKKCKFSACSISEVDEHFKKFHSERKIEQEC